METWTRFTSASELLVFVHEGQQEGHRNSWSRDPELIWSETGSLCSVTFDLWGRLHSAALAFGSTWNRKSERVHQPLLFLENSHQQFLFLQTESVSVSRFTNTARRFGGRKILNRSKGIKTESWVKPERGPPSWPLTSTASIMKLQNVYFVFIFWGTPGFRKAFYLNFPS